jgi:membrane protease YdiL (CAAX protease family)
MDPRRENELDHPAGDPVPAPAAPFVELAAAGRNDWWRYALGLVAIVFATGIGGAAAVPLFRLGAGLGTSLAALTGFVAIMFPFAVVLAAALIVLPRLHRRPWRSFVTGRRAFDRRGALVSFAVTFGLFVLAILLELASTPGDLEFARTAGPILLFLPFVVLLIPIQVLAEEVVFRGYLLQLVARLTGRTWLRLLIPTALFSLLHLGNPDVTYGGIWGALTVVVIALYLAHLAIRGNGLEHAAGFHLGLNLFGLVVVSHGAATIPTPTILVDRAPSFALGLAVILAVCALHYWIVFRRPRARGMVRPGEH